MRKGGVNRMRKKSSSISYVDTTPNRMEIRAILAVLVRIDRGYDIDIYSDSEYCVRIVNSLMKRWSNIPKANSDLWKKVSQQLKDHKFKGSHINCSWVRGHSGNTFNEMAHKLADIGANRDETAICDKKYWEKKAERDAKRKTRTIK
jgi:ribonuclease HI